MYTVYILYSISTNRYYVGHTQYLDNRLQRHNAGRSKYTKAGIPWKLMYKETFETKSEAYKRECYIKAQKSRRFIEKLINE